MKEGLQFDLPQKRRASFTETVYDLDFKWLAIWGVGSYVGPVILISLIEYLIGGKSHLTTSQDIDFGDIVYFNFVSMLTIGYGDMSPIGIFRIFTIIEAFFGLAIYSLSISIITIKLLLPRKNSIVFSKFAYYCLDANAFMIIYLNTSSQFVTNLETTWYFKLDKYWETQPPVRVPFITKSVQTFNLKFDKKSDEIIKTLHPDDCLRIGLSGNIGMASYSTYVEYGVKDILVLDDKKVLAKYDGFYKVDESLNSETFANYFHYSPKEAVTLNEWLKHPDNKNNSIT